MGCCGFRSVARQRYSVWSEVEGSFTPPVKWAPVKSFGRANEKIVRSYSKVDPHPACLLPATFLLWRHSLSFQACSESIHALNVGVIINLLLLSKYLPEQC